MRFAIPRSCAVRKLSLQFGVENSSLNLRKFQLEFKEVPV
jgi:hypothetical protein